MHQSLGQVVNAGGGLFRPSTEAAACEAWREEAKAWCQGGKRAGEKQRNFNKRFLGNKNSQALLNAVDPEKPIGVLQKATGQVTALARSNPQALAVLQSYGALVARYKGFGGNTITGKGMCSGLNQRIRGQLGKGTTGVHADAVFKHNGTPIEIKGPGDRLGKNQLTNLQKCSPTGEVIIIDHTGCDVEPKICTREGSCKASAKASPTNS